jgi:hypothetical protein
LQGHHRSQTDSLGTKHLHSSAVVFEVPEAVCLSADGLHLVVTAFGDGVVAGEAPQACDLFGPGMERVAGSLELRQSGLAQPGDGAQEAQPRRAAPPATRRGPPCRPTRTRGTSARLASLGRRESLGAGLAARSRTEVHVGSFGAWARAVRGPRAGTRKYPGLEAGATAEGTGLQPLAGRGNPAD